MRTSETQTGFSLVEIIIALFLVGMIVIVISNLPNAVNLVTSSQSDSIIREVAAKKMEDIRLAGYDNLPENSTTAINDTRLNKLPGVAAHTVISDCPVSVCPGNEEVKQVQITISWNENGEAKTYQLETLVGRGGVK